MIIWLGKLSKHVIYCRREILRAYVNNFGLFLKTFGSFYALHLDLGGNNTAWSRGIDTTSGSGYGVSTIFDFVHSEAFLVLKFLAAPFANDVCWLRMYIFDMHANPILGISD